MKKIIVGSLILVGSLLAKDSITVVPYYGTINYKNDVTSLKDDGQILGTYFSMGNLGYLVELDYANTKIKYKDVLIEDLKQDDVTLTYAKYNKSVMFKGGIHYIDTTDSDLGDGEIIIGQVGGYLWKGYNKHSYGVEGYYSIYSDGHDENGIEKNIDVIQLTPYYQYSKAININTRNVIGLKVNYQNINAYNQKNYTSFEVEDTLYYKKVYGTVKAYGGEMKTGVKDGGYTVFNTKDLMKDGYSLKLGYFVNKSLSLSASYANNNFKETGQTEDTSNDIIVGTLSYSF